MFSPRLIAVLALVATVAALPATEKPKQQVETSVTDDDFYDAPWFSFPMFGNLFAPLWRLFPSFGDIGPKIVVDDDKFQVIVNVKDYSKSDLKVKVKGDFILLQGTHEAKHDDHDLFASQFFHTYSLPANCSGADVTADLYTDSILKVTAPINGPSENKDTPVDREVPIVEAGVPYKDDKEVSTAKPAAVTEDDRKEETTPSVDSTEKDNSIPHGNEELSP